MIKRRINKIRKYDYSRLKKELIFYLKIILLLSVILLFVFGVVKIYINMDNDIINSLLWCVLNALGYGGFFVMCGFFTRGLQAKNIRIYLILLIITLLISGIGTLNITFYFGFPIFFYHYFSLGTADGLYFLLGNFHIFGIIFIISIPLEREVSK